MLRRYLLTLLAALTGMYCGLDGQYYHSAYYREQEEIAAWEDYASKVYGYT